MEHRPIPYNLQEQCKLHGLTIEDCSTLYGFSGHNQRFHVKRGDTVLSVGTVAKVGEYLAGYCDSRRNSRELLPTE